MPLVLAPLLLGFGVVAAFIVLYGLSQASQAVTGSKQPAEQGGLWGWIKHGLSLTPIGVGVELIATVLGEANKRFRTTISHWADAHLRPLTAWFVALGTLILHTFRGLGAFAEATERAIAHLTTVVVPREAHRAAAKPLGVARSAARTGSHALARARSAEAEAERLFGRARRGIDALRHDVTRTIPREIHRVRAAEKALEREIPAGLKGRLRALERAVAFGSLAAVVLRVLARRFPWLFCRKVKTAGQLVCGLDNDLFNAILQDALLIGGTVSLVEFAREMVDVTEQAVRPIASFWQAD